MMINKSILLTSIAGMVLSLAACSGDRVDQAAKEACRCLEPVYEKVNKLMGSAQGGDMSAMATMANRIQASKNEADGCMNKLKEKYQDIDKDPERRRLVGVRMQQMCPRPSWSGGS
jgi:DNA repair ATPase RecN